MLVSTDDDVSVWTGSCPKYCVAQDQWKLQQIVKANDGKTQDSLIRTNEQRSATIIIFAVGISDSTKHQKLSTVSSKIRPWFLLVRNSIPNRNIARLIYCFCSNVFGKLKQVISSCNCNRIRLISCQSILDRQIQKQWRKQFKALALLYAYEESVDWALLSFLR